METSKMKLPNFFGIGVAKSGTTSLYNYLRQHPEIYLTPIKETNYFARNDLKFEHFRKDFKYATTINVDKYVNGDMNREIHCANVTEWEHYLKLYKNVQNEKAIGEICNSYFFCPSAANEIKEVNPSAKIIVFFRNPIERVFSGYMMNLREGRTLEKNFIKELENDMHKKIKGWGVAFNYLEMGLYYDQLKRLKKHFNDEQIKAVIYDDYKANQAKVLKDIFEFLGVDKEFRADLGQRYNTGSLPRSKYLSYFLAQTGFIKIFFRAFLPKASKNAIYNIIYTKRNMPRLKPDERAYLVDYYRNDVKMLSNELNRDLSHWLT